MRYSLQEIKNRSTGFFFSRDTMKFFRGMGKAKYGTRYDKETGVNYVVVTDPWNKRHFHVFHPDTGDITPISSEYVPLRVREK